MEGEQKTEKTKKKKRKLNSIDFLLLTMTVTETEGESKETEMQAQPMCISAELPVSRIEIHGNFYDGDAVQVWSGMRMQLQTRSIQIPVP